MSVDVATAAWGRVDTQIDALLEAVSAALAACRRKHTAVAAVDDERTTYLTGRRISVPGSGLGGNAGTPYDFGQPASHAGGDD